MKSEGVLFTLIANHVSTGHPVIHSFIKENENLKESRTYLGR